MTEQKPSAGNGMLRQLAVWTRRYAENRTLPTLLFLLVYLLINILLKSASHFTQQAYFAHHWSVLAGALAVLLLALVFLVWLSVPGWGTRWVRGQAERLYHTEGIVETPRGRLGDTWAQFIVVLFIACVITTAILGSINVIPSRYLQPVSALYLVPFLLVLAWQRGGDLFSWVILWATLYVAHALLVIAGAPILFFGPWFFLNMWVPTIGYGLFAALIGHLFSRLALARIRRLSRRTLEEGTHD